MVSRDDHDSSIQLFHFWRKRMSSIRFFERLELRQLLAATPGSLQAAIDSAAPGSTIDVGAGTVQELVTVNKPLTIRGARAGVDARDKSRGTGETIIEGADFGGGNRSTSFYITASNVTIDGFVVQDDSSSNQFGAGIVIAPGVSGAHIVNNIVQSNISGLYLANASNTNPAVIQHNVFQNNNNQGENSGRGIYTDDSVSGGKLTRVVIDSNWFIGNVGFGPPANPQAAIGLEAQTAGKQSNITITNNVMQGNGKGVLIFNADNITIAGNLMTASTDANGAAIRIEGGSNNINIHNNTVTGNLGMAMRVSKLIAGPNSNIVATNNNFYGNTGGGLRVESGGYSGTLDATHNWWGSDKGPGGDGPGFGDALIASDHNVDFDPWATSLLGAQQPPTSDSGTPRGLRQILVEDLAHIRDGTKGRMRGRLNDAIANFKATLADSLWADDSHLAPGAGELVFRLDQKALKLIKKSIKGFKHSKIPDGVLETIQRITNLERTMAMLAIDSAAGGNAKKLVKANHELSAGVNDVGRGDYAPAIDHFMAAWKLAIDADRNPPRPQNQGQGESETHKKKKHKKHEHDENQNEDRRNKD
jgi:parallel beta-helix repeat protein